MKSKASFPREEKLKQRSHFELLYAEGSNFAYYPLAVRYRWTTREGKGLGKAGFSVSKRRFKKAVHRNRIKRRLREAYRLQKEQLEMKPGVELHVLFIYMPGKELAFKELYSSMEKILQRLHNEHP